MSFVNDVINRYPAIDVALRKRLLAALTDAEKAEIANKDADSGHDIKNVLHCVEGRIEWLERQLDAINECGGLTAYYAAKISG